MTDFADLGMRIDSTQVAKGVSELDKLTAAGARAEGATGKVTRSAAEQAAQMKVNADAINQVVRATNPAVSSMSQLDAALKRVQSAYIQGKVSAEVYAKAQVIAARGAVEFAATTRQVAASAGQQRAGMQQLSFQIGDVAQQFALGTPPMRIFAQQGAQVVQAVGLMTNSSKGLIGFLGGPWGAVMLGAVTILGSLFAAHTKAAEGADTQKMSAEDLTDALNDLHDAAVKEIQSAYDQVKANLAAAESHRIRAVEARKAAIAELQLAKANIQQGQSTLGNMPSKGGMEIASMQMQTGAQDVRRLDAQIKSLNKEIGTADETIRLRQGQLINMKLEEALDKGAAATGKFNRAQDALNKQLNDGTISLDEYAKKSRAAMETRDREEEAARKSDRARKERKRGLTDEQRAYEQAKKATDSYIESLSIEIEKIGKTPAQIRAIDIAHAKEGAATDAQRKKIDELSAAREKALAIAEAEEKAKQRAKNDAQLLDPIKEELVLLGLTGEAREKAALKMEYESKTAQILAGDLNISAEALQKWYDTSLQVIEGESALEREAKAARDLVDAMNAVAENAQALGDILGSAFGGIGDVFGGIIANMADYQAQSAELAEQVKSGAMKQEVAEKRLATLNMKNTASAIAGVKSLFKEKSTGYKVMQAIEMAYAAFQAANTIAAIARDATHTASSVANAGVRATADTVAGGAKIFSQLGVFAFPVVAAMIAVLASLGLKGGGGGGGGPSVPSAEDIQGQAGTGSILGDSKAKSQSIANSLEIVAANTNKDLEYSNQMLTALRSIDFSISKLAGTVAKQIQVSGSMFDTSKLNLGSSGSGGFLGMFASSTTKTLWDLGVNLASSSVADIIENGIEGYTYQTVQKVKKKSGFLGIGGGTKTSYKTTKGAIDQDIKDAISDVVQSLRDGLLSAADVIGLQGAEAILNSFNVSLGKISFKDMTGQEIEDQLNAIFSKVGDDMAGAVFPALKDMQKIGEGLFETFIRVAREYEVVDVALRSIGKEFGAVGVASVAARDNLVQLFGGLDEFVEATNDFRDEFLTEAEQISPIQQAVIAEMQRLGLAGITTRDQFKAAVLGLDLTTQAGRDMYAALLKVAPAFDKVLDYFDDINKAARESLESTRDQFTKFAESLRKYRDTLFATDATQGAAYTALKARFISTANLAANGDATALGGLEGAGKDFLTSAKNNASTLQQYLRDVALVARGVDSGIFAAEETADYAQLQLDALLNQTSILQQIAQNTAPPASGNVQTLPTPVGVPVAAQSFAATPAEGPTAATEVAAMREDVAPTLEAIASVLAEINRRFNRWDDGDGMVVTTRDGEPLDVNLESWG